MTNAAQSAAHWCYVGRSRVKRLGSPASCPQCMRYTNKHKCGMVRDSKAAWKPYPVTDCASCMVSTVPSEGPLQGLQPVRAPKGERDPAKEVERHPLQERIDRTKARWDKIASASKRRSFLVLCLAVNGPMHATDFYRLVKRTYEVSSRRLYKDVQELIELRWVLAEQVNRADAPQWQSQTENRYSINPQLLAMVTA